MQVLKFGAGKASPSTSPAPVRWCCRFSRDGACDDGDRDRDDDGGGDGGP